MTTVGSRDEAAFLAENVFSDGPRYRGIKYSKLEKLGWKMIGSNSAYRAVFLAPSGFVYKVQKLRHSPYWNMNATEAKNWADLRNDGLGSFVPNHQLYTIDVAQHTIEIMAVEYLPPLYENGDEKRKSLWNVDQALYSRLTKFVSDLHFENLYEVAEGRYVVIDAGADAYA